MKSMTKIFKSFVACVVFTGFSTTTLFANPNEYLLKAVQEDNLELAKNAITAGADVNLRGDEHGRTPLMLAAGNNSVALVQLLIKNGAEVDAKSDYGGTALIRAAFRNSLDVARFLIGHGAEINAKDNDGNTALMGAARRDPLNLDLMKLLVEHGAEVNVKDNDGMTALMWVSLSSLEAVRFLIEHGANVSVKSNDGWTALMIAEAEGKAEIAAMLRKAEQAVVLESEKEGENSVETPLDPATKNANGHASDIDEVEKYLSQFQENVKLQEFLKREDVELDIPFEEAQKKYGLTKYSSLGGEDIIIQKQPVNL